MLLALNLAVPLALLLALASCSADQKSVARGKELFAVACARCHGPAGHGDGPIGLHDRTRPCQSFRAVQGRVYHDGRFETLLDVVNHHDRHLSLKLNPEQKQDLVEFLKSL